MNEYYGWTLTDVVKHLIERIEALESQVKMLQKQGEADRKREYLRHASLTRRLRELETHDGRED